MKGLRQAKGAPVLTRESLVGPRGACQAKRLFIYDMCYLLILHIFALSLFSCVHAFAPYLFCCWLSKANTMGAPVRPQELVSGIVPVKCTLFHVTRTRR